MENLKIIIMCGGNGTRLWPLSRKLLPKQFLKLTDELTMFQVSCKTALALNPKQLIIICNEKHHFIIQDQLSELSIDNYLIISEPCGKDTCAAIATAVLYTEPTDDLLVMTADHVWDETTFVECVKKGFLNIDESSIGFLGIKPCYPETGYGYIETGQSENNPDLKTVLKFKEKPDKEVAEEYVANGNFYWNSGVFLFNNLTMLKELKTYQSEILKNIAETKKHSEIKNKIIKLNNQYWKNITSISIDYAIMENHKNGVLIPYTGYWCDIGSFKALFNHLEKDENNCVLGKDTINIDSNDCLVMTENRLVGLIGCNNLVVIDTRDALLVCNKDKTQDVKKMVSILKKNNSHLPEYHTKVYRPWGWYINVEGTDTGGFKVKRIGVYPGKRLSLQSHYKRSEHWVIVKGKAKVQVGKDFHVLNPNQHIYIPKETLHRMENIGDEVVEFVETQIGEYLGEEDIVRYEDDFGRV